MKYSARELSKLLEGDLEGNPSVVVSSPARIEEGAEGTVSFIANPKYTHFAYNTRSSVLIVDKEIKFDRPLAPTLIRVSNSYESFSRILKLFSTNGTHKSGIEQPSFISSTALIGKDCYVGAFSYVGDHVSLAEGSRIYPQCFIGSHVSIGQGTVIHPGVRIYHGCVIGSNCIIHSGAVIGSDGFGFVPQANDSFKKIEQIGNVVIEDDVEVGANTTIDRATMGSTLIRRGVKLDNLIQVAHNVEIGEGTVVAAQSGVSGSTRLGKHCMIGGQVGFAGHLKIADGTRINAKSGVSRSVEEPGKALNGIPAFEYMASLRSQAAFRRLPDLEKKLLSLENQLKEMAKRLQK